MSFLLAVPESLAAAVTDVVRIGSSLSAGRHGGGAPDDGEFRLGRRIDRIERLLPRRRAPAAGIALAGLTF